MQNLGSYSKVSHESIRAALRQIQEVRASARDYIVPAGKVEYIVQDGGSRLRLTSCDGKVFRVGEKWFSDWSHAEAEADQVDGEIEVCSHGDPLRMSETAESQLLARLGIPTRFARSLAERNCEDVLKYACDRLAQEDGGKWLIRTVGDKIRAVLSNSYKTLDNFDLMLAATKAADAVFAEPWKMRVSDDRFELFLGSSNIQGEVRQDRPEDLGGRYRWQADASQPDTHYACCWISNSETGRGGLNVQPSILRAICANYMLWGDVVRTIHLGRRREEEGLVYSEETEQAEGHLVWSKLKDIITTTFDQQKFDQYIDSLNGLTQILLPEDTIAVVGSVSVKLQVSEKDANDVLKRLLGSGDLTAYGLVQAFTEAAHDHDQADAEKALALEVAGSKIAGSKASELRALLTV